MDDDAENSGQKLFQCEYSDGDVEWLDEEEAVQIMLPAEDRNLDQFGSMLS